MKTAPTPLSEVSESNPRQQQKNLFLPQFVLPGKNTKGEEVYLPRKLTKSQHLKSGNIINHTITMA